MTDSTKRTLGTFSFGVGDRFGHQAKAQLQAFVQARDLGVALTPVWNKSNREHTTIGSEPQSTRTAADAAIQELGWTGDHFVDADHINLDTVDRFVASSDFFTIDVADAIGQPPLPSDLDAFVARHPELLQPVEIEGIEGRIELDEAAVRHIAGSYLTATVQAASVYQHIEAQRPGSVIEVSMDETDAPQTPPELLVILAALGDAGVPAQTIAPKFTGRFNKGVDYVGDLAQFEKEFAEDIAVIGHAAPKYGLPENLKLSVHSGSDKFSIYAPIGRVLKATGAGLHIKTAGTTWLEELIGLAEADGDGLKLAKDVYSKAYAKIDALCAPYATVIDVKRDQLPSDAEARNWTAEQFVAALRHEPDNPSFNSSFRQLLHVGYKIAADMGDQYLDALDTFEESIARNVTHNIFERHIRPLFIG